MAQPPVSKFKFQSGAPLQEAYAALNYLLEVAGYYRIQRVIGGTMTSGPSGAVIKIPDQIFSQKSVFPFEVYANPREGHPNDYSIRPGIVDAIWPKIEGVSLIHLPDPPSLPIAYQDYVWFEAPIVAGVITGDVSFYAGPEPTAETDSLAVYPIFYMDGYIPDGATDPVLVPRQLLKNNLRYASLPGFFQNVSGGGDRSVAHSWELV